MTLLLASRSAARRQMLEAAGIAFEVVDPAFDEEAAKDEWGDLPPRELAARLAEGKARGVPSSGDDVVIGADQVLERDDGMMLSKPGSIEDAGVQLAGLRGRRHFLHSAASIVSGDRLLWEGIETATLTMREFGDGFLRDYLAREYEAVRSNVGAYRIEGPGIQLFERIEGSHFAILGLPLLSMLAFLRDLGVVSR